MYVCANRIVAAATSPEGLLRAGSITEGNQGVDVHNAFKKKPEPALATCDVPGCHRVTWNGKPNEQCCRTCKNSGGSKHGPDCERKHDQESKAEEVAAKKAADEAAAKKAAEKKRAEEEAARKAEEERIAAEKKRAEEEAARVEVAVVRCFVQLWRRLEFMPVLVEHVYDYGHDGRVGDGHGHWT